MVGKLIPIKPTKASLLRQQRNIELRKQLDALHPPPKKLFRKPQPEKTVRDFAITEFAASTETNITETTVTTDFATSTECEPESAIENVNLWEKTMATTTTTTTKDHATTPRRRRSLISSPVPLAHRTRSKMRRRQQQEQQRQQQQQ